MNTDGSGLTRLTNNLYTDIRACWSPNGNKMAFMSYRYGSWEIFSMKADGSEQINLTNNPAHESYPDWDNRGQGH